MKSLTNIRAVSRLERIIHAVHLLLVADQMLDSRHDTLLLDAFDRQSPRNALEHWVSAEALPVAATQRLASHGADRRAEVDIRAFAAELLADRDRSRVNQVLVEGGPSRDSRGEGCDVVRGSDSERGILEAELREVDAICATCISYTWSEKGVDTKMSVST